MSKTITLQQLAQQTDGKLVGNFDKNTTILAANSLLEATSSEVSFLGNKKYLQQINASKAAAIFVGEDFASEDFPGKVLILVKNPSSAFSFAVDLFAPEAPIFPSGIQAGAYIAESAQVAESSHIGANAVIEYGAIIGENAIIGAGSYVGPQASIGKNTQLHPNTTIRERCKIGERCIIHSSTVIGSDGFGFIPGRDGHTKIPQVGIVRIEDDVEVGSNSSIDRARFGETVIGQGTKIDNLVQIAHNVRIGKHCFIVSQVGIAGSSSLGNLVTIAGQSGVAGHVHISDGVTVMGQSGVSHDLAPGLTVMGCPAVPHKEHIRERFQVRKIAKLEKRLKALESLIKQD